MRRKGRVDRSSMPIAGWIFVAALAVLFVAGRGSVPVLSQGPVRADADAGTRLDDATRARSFTYAAGVPAEVQNWFASALARVQPPARRLIDAVDGQVTVQIHGSDVEAAGFVRPLDTHFILSLDFGMLRGHADEIRDHVIAHEIGHVVDLALVPASLNAQLDVGVPRLGGCDGANSYADGACAPLQERFADTFAKWALQDPVVLAGVQSVGYRVAPPANLALWGEPLADLPA